jgi:cytochrome c oxidase subunit 2
MLGTVFVETPEEHRLFLDSLDKPPPGLSPEQWGEKLFVANGCPTCHGAGGSGQVGGAKSPGPKLVAVFGHSVDLVGAPSVMADENYIRESILRPNAKIVAGYQTVAMPPFVFKDPQIEALTAYIKGLK